MKLWRYNEIIQMRSNGVSISMLRHPCKQCNWLSFGTSLFSTFEKRRIRLITNATSLGRVETAVLISKLRAAYNHQFATLSKIIPHLRLVSINPHTMKELQS